MPLPAAQDQTCHKVPKATKPPNAMRPLGEPRIASASGPLPIFARKAMPCCVAKSAPKATTFKMRARGPMKIAIGKMTTQRAKRKKLEVQDLTSSKPSKCSSPSTRPATAATSAYEMATRWARPPWRTKRQAMRQTMTSVEALVSLSESRALSTFFEASMWACVSAAEGAFAASFLASRFLACLLWSSLDSFAGSACGASASALSTTVLMSL
mmetsp:Transcript_49015/g.124388  ORF Transcript_49015/g.124388 Transcript_49015/m.124388 type:complete len:212 (+) Transcript_49015:160-795(+)